MDGLTSAAEQISSEIPEEFYLYQNYSNAVNPSTTIKFSLPERTTVKLTVLNLHGQEVATLVAGEMPAGIHKVTWDGRDEAGKAFSSGPYFYHLSAGTFRETRKMILLG